MEDPAFYVNPWPVYSRLQREAPVYYQRSLNTWVVTRYDDVRAVARTPEVFSAAQGILLLDGVKSGAGAQDLFAGGADFIGLLAVGEIRYVFVLVAALTRREGRLLIVVGRRGYRFTR